MSKKRLTQPSRKIISKGAPGSQRGARNNPTAPSTTAVHLTLNSLKTEPQLVQLLLKESIMSRRRDQGLAPVQVEEPELKNYELTPAEIEKKERRKEQNRRAARKCRAKKRLLQYVAADDYTKVVEENQQMEQEICMLRQERKNLQNILNQHMLSGECVHVKKENQAPPALPSCSSSSSLDSSSAMSASPESCETVPNVPFDQNDYLEGLGPLSPEMTFGDLDLAVLETFIDIDGLDVDGSVATSTNNLSSQLSQSLVVPGETSTPNALPFSSPPQPQISTSVPFTQCNNSTEMMKGLYMCPPACRFSPISSPGSPGAFASHRHHDRHPSTSSVTSEWSVISDQSQGFHQVPERQDRPSPVFVQYTSVGSVSSEGLGEEPSSMDFAGFDLLMPTSSNWQREDEEDDVFLTHHTRSDNR